MPKGNSPAGAGELDPKAGLSNRERWRQEGLHIALLRWSEAIEGLESKQIGGEEKFSPRR